MAQAASPPKNGVQPGALASGARLHMVSVGLTLTELICLYLINHSP